MEVKIIEKPRVGIYNRTRPGEDLAEEIKKENKVVSKYLENNDVELVGIYRDINCHTVEERPAYNRMIKDIFEGKVDTLVVTDISRLTRNNEILEKIKNEVKIISLNDNYKVICQSFQEIEEYMQEVEELINECYSKDLSRRIKQDIKLSKEKKKANK